MGGSSYWVLKRNMHPFSGSFSIFVSSILHTLFRFFSSIFLRFEKQQRSLVNESCSSTNPAAMPQKAEPEALKSDDESEYYDAEDEKETLEPSFVFKFEYQTKAVLEAMEKVNAYGHSSVIKKENWFLPEKFSSRRYAFQPKKNVSFYEEEPKVARFAVREEASAYESTGGSMVIENEGLKQLVTEECVQVEEAKFASSIFKEDSVDTLKSAISVFKEDSVDTLKSASSVFKEDEDVNQLVTDECAQVEAKFASSVFKEDEGVKQLVTGECVHIPQNSEKKQVDEDSHSGNEEQLKSQENDSVDENVASHEDKFSQEKEFVAVESASESDSDSDSDSGSDSHSGSLCSSPELSFIGQFSGDGFLLETDLSERVEFGALEDINLQNLDVGYEPDGFDEEDEDIMEQLKELEVSTRNDEHHHNQKESKPEAKDEEPKEVLENSEHISGQDSTPTDSEDPNTLETLWEHQELIEQLKMELKKVRGSGLPTILEESESPNMEDLKPWKIDEKYHHGDRMSVLHKFYKSYRERMRKLDILSYQKLYAIGFLQSKDTFAMFSSYKSSILAIKTFLMQNFGLCKPKKSSDSDDPMVKFIRELHSELEGVYVGQLCMSWEFLQWQYEKALELWEFDEYGLRTYNEVAEEFQQFQVLMQRFVENERFQGPRVENYVKNRCVMRNLLQIPVIREDSKEKKKAKKKLKDDDYVIGSDLLVEILQESIRTMWRFIRADKSTNTTDACRKRSKLEAEDSFDPKLLVEVQADLQKKEKKLKELLRSENCILKRFRRRRRHEEEEEEEEEERAEHLYFFCQVDIKLVSRVLNMSSITTDQLVWCHNKLSRIHFMNHRIRVDPSFLLFPC